MAELPASCSDAFFADKWKSWCRLCAKDATEYVTVVSSSHEVEPLIETDLKPNIDLAHVILEFFQIHIKEDDKLSQIICTECHRMVLSINKFKDRAIKVQQMYNDLQNMPEKSASKLSMLLENYGIFKDESFIPQNGIEMPLEKIFVAGLEDTTPTIPSHRESCMENEDFSAVQHLEIIQKKEDVNDFDDPFCNEDNVNDGSYLPSGDSDGCSDSDDSNDSDDSDDSFFNSKAAKSKEKAKQKKTATTKSKSPTESSVTCKLCSQSFQRRCNYSRHMRLKHGVLACKQCPNSFATRILLKRHMKEHNKRVYNCQHCDQTFERKGLASQHMKMEHKNETKKKTKSNNSSFVCESCGEELRTRKMLQKHMLTHAEFTPIECKVCGKSFNKVLQLQRHMQKHGDKYICPECGKQLSCRKALHHHMLVHSDILKHKCDFCGRAFKRPKALKDHILAHTSLRPYSCNFCGKTFSTGSSCRFHKKNMHPVELAEWEASGAIAFTNNIPSLSELREMARAGKNLHPLMSKQEGYINPQNTIELQPNDCTVQNT